jgi:hypothetical protein
MIQSLSALVEKLTALRISRRATIYFLGFITLIAETLLIVSVVNNPIFISVVYARLIHLFITIGILLFLAFKKNMSKKLELVLFVGIFLPIAAPLWILQQTIVATGAIGLTFSGVHILLISAAILYSGSFLLNLALISIFTLEILILWFKFSANYDPKEPYATLAIAFISVCLLYFRYQDEMTFKKLAQERLKSSLMENLAKMFLSFRDRANSPLQTLYLVSEILKKDPNQNPALVDNLTSSVNRLKEISAEFKKYENHIPWNDERHLMSSQEIDEWLKKLEHDLE